MNDKLDTLVGERKVICQCYVPSRCNLLELELGSQLEESHGRGVFVQFDNFANILRQESLNKVN